MSRTILLFLAALAASASPAMAATHSYSVTSFDRLRIAGPFDVHVHVGGSPAVRATGPQDALDRLSIEQNDDTVVVKTLPGGWGGWPGGSHGQVVVDVVAPSLAQVAVTGSGGVTVDRVKGDALAVALSGSGSLAIGAIDVDALTATMTGSGDLALAGQARTAAARVTGSGGLKAGGLATTDAEAYLVGSGDLTLGARHTAKAVLTGSGDLTIVGPASCTINRTGSGDVHCDHPSRD